MLHGLEFGRSDLLFGLGSAALVAITMANDEDLQQHVVDADPPDWELFGSPAFLAPPRSCCGARASSRTTMR
jgi:hypothetical protein